ncbi:MAG TPA: FTR1 family protein [Pyrinomonadaceae bacterium]|nr:FTR1 family protein [Pyrinomonadaceae bacterium]
MLQSFIIVLREGFESFLLVAVILAYLRKTNQRWLTHAVYWAVAVSVAASTALAYVLKNGVNEQLVEKTFGESVGFYVNAFFANESLREGILGLVAILMVATLVIYMWRTGSRLKGKMEKRLGEVSSSTSRLLAFTGVFTFTALMMVREGMETALMLLQIHEGQIAIGILLGISAAGLLAWSWARFSHLINVRRFFQVTGVFLLLFMVQVGIYSFHELCEAGIFPNSDAMHAATEIYSPDGLYGKWFSLIMVSVCAMWLLSAWIADRIKMSRQGLVEG